MIHRLIIFDLDGTLVDSFADIAAAVNATLATMGAESLPHDAIKRHVGRGARWLLSRCLHDAGLDPELHLATAREHFLPFYKDNLAIHTTIYPGVETTLCALAEAGATLALCTNKPTVLTGPLLEKLGLDAHFAMVLGADSLPTKKPDPAPLLHIAEALSFRPDEGLMVGDSEFDIKAGKAAGMHTCGVTYGHHKLEQIEALSPDWIIDQLPELLSLPPLEATP